MWDIHARRQQKGTEAITRVQLPASPSSPSSPYFLLTLFPGTLSLDTPRLENETHDARTAHFRVREFQPDALPGLREQPLPAPEDQRMHPDPIFVDKVVLHQRLHQHGAAVHLDVAARLPLQPCDFLRDVALNDRCVPVQRLFERLRSHELRNGIHPLEIRPALDLAP